MASCAVSSKAGIAMVLSAAGAGVFVAEVTAVVVAVVDGVVVSEVSVTVVVSSSRPAADGTACNPYGKLGATVASGFAAGATVAGVGLPQWYWPSS